MDIFLLFLLFHIQVVTSSFDDTIHCEDFTANTSVLELQQEALGFGQCIPYTAASDVDGSRPNPCNKFFTPNMDTFYLPSGRARDNAERLYTFASDANIVIDVLSPQCRDPGARAICYYYFPPCGNITHFQPPNALCQDTCFRVAIDTCALEWKRALEFFEGLSDFVNSLGIQFLNCSQPGEFLRSLPHCCSDAGIIFEEPTTNATGIPTRPSSATTTIAAAVSASLAAFLVIATAIVVTMLVVLIKRSRRKIVLEFGTGEKRTSVLPLSVDNPPTSTTFDRYQVTLSAVPSTDGIGEGTSFERARVSSGFIRNMSESKLLIPGRHIQLLDVVGKGEFGVVYRSHLSGWQGRTTAELVAVKTLKDFHSMKDIDDLMKESDKMKNFEHPNVLNLIGVCTDAGDAPFIVMPYMANGSLLVYLRKERPHFTIAEEAGDEMIADTQRKLLSICLQIAKGMNYLAEQKFVHRDLAARNCMIDQHSVIKVADFGLSEDVYSRNYFRQGQPNGEGSAVKLPIRWMALESLLDSVFMEKTDVWSYGVTCWEVFSLGHTPYPGVDPFALVKFLQDGGRLDKPSNAACTQQVYELMIHCWTEVADKRPSFQELVQDVNTLLEGVAGYLDFSAFSGESRTRGYDHLEKRTTKAGGYDHLENIQN